MTRDGLIDELCTLGDLKVWSLIVTLLGDCDGQSISGPEISALMARLSIKSEALRVALHRLRRDGWIESDKHGRVSHYRMSQKAQIETDGVRDFVYARTLDLPSELWLVQADGDLALSGPAVFLTRQTALTETPVTGPVLTASVAPADLPEWVIGRLLTKENTLKFKELAGVISSYEPAGVNEDASPVCRLIILHLWRRLVLRHTPLALSLLPPDHPASLCRQEVFKWMQAVPRFRPEAQPSA